MLHDYAYFIKYDNTYSHVSSKLYDTYVTLLVTIEEEQLVQYNIYKGYDKAIIGKNTTKAIVDKQKFKVLVMPLDVFEETFSEQEKAEKLCKDFR